MVLQVHIGENLNYTYGSLQYPSDVTADSTSTTDDILLNLTTTTIIIIAAIAAVVVFIIMLSIIVIICVVRKRSKRKYTIAFTGNTDVSMYASPAYGTHQVFTIPGQDHLYDRIDVPFKERSTALQDPPTVNDDETDVDGYHRMNPSCEVIDQAVTGGNVDDTASCKDECIQAADDKDHLPTGNDGQERLNAES